MSPKKPMSNVVGFGCFILTLLSCVHPQERTDLIALKNFKIVTLEDENVITGKILIIKQDSILDIIPDEEFYSEYNLPDSLIHDGNGKYLMPSLNDMHLHLQPINPNHKKYLSHLLGYGITNVRVMNGNENLLSWKDSIELGLLLGPEFRVAGPLIDGEKPLWGKGHTGPVVMNKEKVDSIVLSHKERKYDLIKLYERLPKEVYLEFLDAAFRYNMKVACHIPYSLLEEKNLDEIFNFISPSFEHFSNFGALVTSNSVQTTKQPGDMHYYGKEMAGDPDSILIKELVSKISEQNIWICPTTVLWRNSADSLRTKSVISAEPFKKIDSGLKNWWLSTRELPKNMEQAKLAELLLKEMAIQKVKVLAGSDFPNPYLIPGYSLHQEIHSMVEMGYTNLEALKSATVYPAEYWGEVGKRGIVKGGSVANLIVLNKNPLEDIRNTLTIDQVIYKGKFLDSKALLDLEEHLN